MSRRFLAHYIVSRTPFQFKQLGDALLFNTRVVLSIRWYANRVHSMRMDAETVNREGCGEKRVPQHGFLLKERMHVRTFGTEVEACSSIVAFA